MRKKTRKKTEFSKLLAIWAAGAATISAAASFLLAAADKQPVSELAITIFSACIGYLITYAGKSLGEKISRNRYGLDANGLPYTTVSPPAEKPKKRDC